MINKNTIEDIYALSPMQEGMLFHQLAQSGSEAYFEQLSCDFEGEIDVLGFKNVWQEIVDRYPVFRTSFHWDGLDKPVQVVHKKALLPWDILDWTEMDQNQISEKFEMLLQDDRRKGFNHEQAPLMRCMLVNTGKERWKFIWSHHHILIDGWCADIVMNELFKRYQSVATGKPVNFPFNPPYKNYISWLGKQDLDKAKAFWCAELAGFNTPTPLGIGDAASMDKNHVNHGYAEYKFNFSSELSTRLFKWSRETGITTNVLIQGAWAILLGCYSREHDVVFGATVSGRPPELQNVASMVGLFINSLPVRIDTHQDIDLITWLKDLQEKNNERNDFTFTPLVDIKKSSGIPGDLPLFRSLLIFENYPFDASSQNGLHGLKIKNISSFEETNYPLTLMIVPRDGILRFQMNYFKDCFEAKEIERLFDHLEMAVLSILDNPFQIPSKVSVLSDAEKEKVLVGFNNTSVAIPLGQTVLDLINEHVWKTPEKIAIVSEQGSFSYLELKQLAEAMKSILISHGVKKGSKVAILQERGAGMIVSILGAMMAGAVFLPIDNSLPYDRILSLIDDAFVEVLITIKTDLPLENIDRLVIIIHPDLVFDTPVVPSNIKNTNSNCGDLAYIIYTSGSTGKPKGVEITHLGLVNYIVWANSYYFKHDMDGGDLPLFTSPGFDVTISSIFIPLTRGKTLYIYGNEEVGEIINDIFDINGTSDTVKITPSHVSLLKDIPKGNNKLRTLIIGGEALKPEHVKTIHDKWPKIVVYNEYGPSEATIGCTANAVTADKIDIGKPIANTAIYILDELLMPLPIGIKGEIFIGGVCLATGYIGQSEQTSLKFINSPFVTGKKIYRTGDIGCWLEDGSIQFFGRKDDQIKIRGYRIEPGEIQNCIIQYPEIIDAIVLPVKNNTEDFSLVAFIKVDEPSIFKTDDLKAALAKFLPVYMMPAQYHILDSFPLTPNGKINKNELLDNFGTRHHLKKIYHAPTNPLEEIIAAIWNEVLKIEKPGIFDNFFECGGHSLNATQITSRIRSIFKIGIGVKDVMEKQTISELAGLVTKLKLKGINENIPPIIALGKQEEAQLSFAQQRLWFLDRLDGPSATYNIPGAVKIEGQLDKTALQRAITEIIDRHQILRTNFFDIDGKPYQSVKKAQSFILPVVVLEAAGYGLLEKQMADEAVKPFNLTHDSLIRVLLFSINEKLHVLSVTMHHIISDGWSSGIFIKELVALYEAFTADKRSPLSPLAFQYSDYAHWQRMLKDNGIFDTQLAYWKNKLSGAPFILDLPTDRPRTKVKNENGSTFRFNISTELSERIRALCKKAGATPFMTLLAAYSVLLSRYSRQPELLIGSVIANRNKIETEPLIGFFINIVVYRINLDAADSFLALVQQVRQLAFEAYAHQDLPFDQLIDEIQPERNMGHNPVFQVAFDMQNMPMPPLEISGLKISSMESERPLAKYDLSLTMEDTSEGLVGAMEYNTNLFDHTTIAQMVGHFQVLLTGIVDNPKQKLWQLSLMGKDEFRKIIYDWNNTDMPLPAGKTVLDIIKQITSNNHSKMAVEYDGLSLGYGQLESESNSLAHRLLSTGMLKGDRIAVIAVRSINLLSVIIGIMKAGGVYLPIDPEYPRDRMMYMLSDSAARIVIGTGDIVRDFDLPFIDYNEDALLKWPTDKVKTVFEHVEPESLAYIIYTSGSTGRPKGVMITHKGLLNLIIEQTKAFKVTEDSKTLQFASLGFDASISEIFLSLCTGSVLVMAPKNNMLPGPDLILLLQTASITHITLPPSILDVLTYTELPMLTTMVVAGEACSRETANTWSKNRHFVNAYGPTEYTVCSTFAPVAMGEGLLNIGRPIGNTVAYILDENHLPQPLGVPGELFIGGDGIASGYVNLPELTAERFIQDPFSKKTGAMMYRTGDMVKYLPDGNISFMGRMDRQVKLRGFRIEPGEVEAVLKQHDSVSQSVVQVQKDEVGHQRLVAFVAMSNTGTNDGHLREWAERPMELWPSVAEFYVYDEFLYYAMTHDERRNDAYKNAIAVAVPGKIVVEIGTGKDAILSRFCADAGAAKIYAIELNENTARLARETVEREGYSDVITIIHGDASEIELPELADVCVSEIVGAIGGSEGSAIIINKSRALLKKGGKMIPERSNTLMAAVSLPSEIQKNHGFNKVPAHYTKEIFDQVGYPFDLRVCIKKFPQDHLLSSKDIFEDLDYTNPIDLETSHPFRLDILKNGRIDGILVWLNLHTMPGVVIDILEHEYCWLPVFMPVFFPGIDVMENDYISGICTRTLCENGLNPDYLLEGKLVRTNGEEVEFSYHSWHNKQVYKKSGFYEKLFANNDIGLLPPSLDVSQQGLEDFLRKKLPSYLMPSTIIVLDKIPLTLNGKVDYQALDQYAQKNKRILNEFTAPQTDKEKKLALIWQSVLGIENVGTHHNFFKLGGDSILSIQIVSRARTVGLEFTPRDLFENQTIAMLASVARIKTKTNADQGLVTGSVPLLPIQSWFFEQEFYHSNHFNQSVVLETNLPVPTEMIQQVINKLVRQHDALRMRFFRPSIEEAWEQEMMIEIPGDIFTYHHFDSLTLETAEDRFLEISNMIQAGLNIEKGIVFKVALIDMGANLPSRLLLIAHHLVVDGVSWRILLDDFFYLLKRHGSGNLPEKSQSFKKWANALSDYSKMGLPAKEAAYWKHIDNMPIPLIPVDFSQKPAVGDIVSSDIITAHLDEERTGTLLKTVPVVYRTNVQEVLLTAFVLSLNQWSGNDTAIIDLEGHGRADLFEDVDVSRTIGWFTTAYPAVFNLSVNAGPEEALQSIKEQFRNIPNKGVGYGLLKYLSGEGSGFKMQHPIEVVFNYLGQTGSVITSDNDWKFSDADCGFEQSPYNHRTHLLSVNIIVLKGKLKVGIGYSKNVHKNSTIDKLVKLFVVNLNTVIDHCLQQGVGSFIQADFPMANLNNAGMDTLSLQIKKAGYSLSQVTDIYCLSPLQQGLLFQSLVDPLSISYREQLSVILNGKLDPILFKKAWQHVIDTYDILRTAFFWDGIDTPVQVVLNKVDVPWNEGEWTFENPKKGQKNIEQFLEDDINQPFLFSKAPLMRFTLNNMCNDSWFFCWTHHHILMDGWSLPIIIRNVFDHYDALQNGSIQPAIPIKPYANFIKWLGAQDDAAAKEWWTTYMAGFHHPTLLCLDRQPDKGRKDLVQDCSIELDVKAEFLLRQFAKNEGFTLNVLVHAAWSLLLGRYSGTDDVVFGSVVSGRPPNLDGVEKMMGLFINSVPVRIGISNTDNLGKWLGEIQSKQLERDVFSYTSLMKIREYCGMNGDLPLFESLIIFENYPLDKTVEEGIKGLTIESVKFSEQTHYQITLMVVPDEKLNFKISYDPSLFEKKTIEGFLRYLVCILNSFPAGVKQTLSDISLIDVEEATVVLDYFNSKAPVLSNSKNVLEAFVQCVLDRPEATALLFNGEKYTYGEIDLLSNQLANLLLKNGLKHGGLVALCLDRSPEMIISLFAILKAGAAYLPLDPRFPIKRLQYMFDNSGASILLTETKYLEEWQPVNKMVMEDIRPILAGEHTEIVAPVILPDDLAYVIYTSGSTGKPKGVQICHGALANFLASMQLSPGIVPSDILLAITTISFDIAGLEIFLPLISGATVALLPDDVAADPAMLITCITEIKPTIMQATPTTWQMLLNEGWHGSPALKILCGGEALPNELAAELAKNNKSLWNMYGPTETTIWSAALKIEPSKHLSPNGYALIGGPIANTSFYILDEAQRPVPVGVAGELHIGGDGLAKGYWGMPELTNEKFLTNPYSTLGKDRMYRTGDLAKWTHTGEISFLGRIDQQVKIRGFRIETGEIESVIKEIDGINDAIVIAGKTHQENDCLLAFVITENKKNISSENIRDTLKFRLPDYMVPSLFISLNKFPLTPNGKIDRNALKSSNGEHLFVTDQQYVAPANQLQQTIHDIWASVLGIPKIGITDNFFALGGHSLLATQCMSRIRTKFEVQLPLKTLFDHPDIKGFAASLQQFLDQVKEALLVTDNEIFEF